MQAAVAGAPVSDVTKAPALGAGAASAGAPAHGRQPLAAYGRGGVAEHDRVAVNPITGRGAVGDQDCAPGDAGADQDGVHGAPAGPASRPADTPAAPAPAGAGRNARRPGGVRNSRFADAHRPPAPPPGEPKLPDGGGKPPAQPRPAPAGAAGSRGHRIMIGAGLVVLAIGAVYAYSLIATDNTAPITGPPSVVPPDGNCVVSYAVWSQDTASDAFKAQVTIANRDAAPIASWRLWLVMNGDQKVSSRLNEGKNIPASHSDATLTQQGPAVTIVSGDALTAQLPATMTISGRYQQSNAAPMAFKLNDKTCETFVSSKPGAPSRPVEHLSNGTTRLGPLPTTGPSVGGAVGPTPTLHPILAHSLPRTTPQFTTPPTTSRFTVVPPGRPETTTPTTTLPTIPPTVPPPPSADPTTTTTDSATPPP